VAGNKINLQKWTTEKEYMETIPFTIAAKKNQIPKSKFNKGCEW
jgi:hypothetical protein